MKRFDIETAVGFFLVLGILSMAYLSIKLGDVHFLDEKGYIVTASFTKTGGLKKGTTVEIAGVAVGKVSDITLDDKTYQAKVMMAIHKTVNISEDSIASIKTKGLLGEKYIQIAPGGSKTLLANGGKIRETESAVDIEELISKYAFGDVK
ncbi:outer membrane lipid asymmetry maintenance protein MlaD [Candidatus Magnetomonas plexicatena]|uniref:outer membrane lipid asymmetry maintenance protein MlaD n=1 Tax=Candidatus Magnetomonas plexicatena TaxID=2552947 RepID=UPI0011049C45|nr:outer membrane lipid asymmetry maintenance protein MlaD [Nitrospirales bacterium LBB_01]